MDFVTSHFGKLNTIAITPKSEVKYVVKVFNWSEIHLSKMTCYKIHTLGAGGRKASSSSKIDKSTKDGPVFLWKYSIQIALFIWNWNYSSLWKIKAEQTCVRQSVWRPVRRKFRSSTTISTNHKAALWF